MPQLAGWCDPSDGAAPSPPCASPVTPSSPFGALPHAAIKTAMIPNLTRELYCRRYVVGTEM